MPWELSSMHKQTKRHLSVHLPLQEIKIYVHSSWCDKCRPLGVDQ